MTEALALAHDLGHPPFGHAGERALDRALTGHGGFDHNAQSLRVVMELERRYPRFDGLNLTFETLEGLAKHNGPILAREETCIGDDRQNAMPDAVRALQEQLGLELDTFPSLEAQVASISDDVAYDCHDLEDGLRAGLVDLEMVEADALAGRILGAVRSDFPALETARTVHELVRRLVSVMIQDVLSETARRIESAGISRSDEARRCGATLVGFSADLADSERALKAFLLANVYRHQAVMRPVSLAEALVAELFGAFSAGPQLMPEPWGRGIGPGQELRTARRVADYIAGMTDRYAVSEHRRLFDGTPDLG